jgi:signal transduction histidine kinase
VRDRYLTGEGRVRRGGDAAERRLARLGFDLHDGPIQDVLALGAEVRLFRGQLARVLGPHPDGAIVLGRVDDVTARLVALDHELREIVRALESPTVLRAPLPELLRREVDGLRDRGVDVTLEISGAVDTLTPSQAIVLLRVVQEALTNVEEHAAARTARVTIAADRAQLRAEVTDDGAGFEVERTLVEAARRGRLGLVGMGERVRLLGGRLDVDSRRGGPTTIAVALPRWQPPSEERRG